MGLSAAVGRCSCQLNAHRAKSFSEFFWAHPHSVLHSGCHHSTPYTPMQKAQSGWKAVVGCQGQQGLLCWPKHCIRITDLCFNIFYSMNMYEIISSSLFSSFNSFCLGCAASTRVCLYWRFYPTIFQPSCVARVKEICLDAFRSDSAGVCSLKYVAMKLLL